MTYFKIVGLVIFLASSILGIPVYEEHQQEVEEHHYAPAQYEFKYGVKDEHTHDIKEQYEKRNGDKVEGYYSLLEPDGTIRTVKYSSDKHTGFNAVVEKSGHANHPAPTKKVVVPVKKVVLPVKKVAYPVLQQSYSPGAIHYAAPAQVYSSAPVLQQGYSQGAAHYSAPVQVYSSAPVLQQSYSQEATHYAPAQVYSSGQSYGGQQSLGHGGAGSYSSISFGSGSAGYGHQE